MNRIKGHIKQIEVSGNLSVVSVNIGNNIILQSIVIETPQTVEYLKPGNEVTLLFKETEVILAQSDPIVTSIENTIAGEVSEIEKGKLLSRVVINTPGGILSSIVSTKALNKLQVNVKDTILVLVKMNEIMLSE